MGILVPEAAIPMGLTLSNVYISFTGEQVYVQSVRGSNVFIINSVYKVYKDETRQPDTNIRIPLAIQVNDISVGVYTLLYESLKQIYSNSIDVID